jgi:hypothetical protein
MRRVLIPALLAFFLVPALTMAQTTGYTYERITVLNGQGAAPAIPPARDVVPDVTDPAPPAPPTCPVTISSASYVLRSISTTGYSAPLADLSSPMSYSAPVYRGLSFAPVYHGGYSYGLSQRDLILRDPFRGYGTVYHHVGREAFLPSHSLRFREIAVPARPVGGTVVRFRDVSPVIVPGGQPSTFNFQKSSLGGTRVSATGDPSAIAAAAAAAQGAAGRRSFLPFGRR